MRSILVPAVMCAALAITTAAHAQCAFPQPKAAKKYSVSLVQGFVSCGNPGGNVPNAITEIFYMPSCAPAETFNQAGSYPNGPNPPNGWRWGANSSGSVQMSAGKNKLVTPTMLNPPDSSDVAVKISVKGIEDTTGAASGPGSLYVVARWTLDDRMGGDMTAIDFPLSFNFDLENGKVTRKTSFNAVLNQIGSPSLPQCTTSEILDLRLRDENGNTLGVVGLGAH